MPENQLFGVMYVGDNDSTQLPADRPGRQHRRRVRRRHASGGSTGMPTNASTAIGDGHRGLGVGRRPDAGPVPLAPARRRQAADRDRRHRRPMIRAGSRTRAALRANIPPAGPARHGQRRQVHRAQRRPGVRRRHEPVGLGPRLRGHPADPAGDLQRPLRHERPAADRRTGSASTRPAATSRRRPPSR